MLDETRPVSSRAEADSLLQLLAAAVQSDSPAWQEGSFLERLDALRAQIESNSELNRIYGRLTASPPGCLAPLHDLPEERKLDEIERLLSERLPAGASIEELAEFLDGVERERPDLEPEPLVEDTVDTLLRKALIYFR